MLCAVFDYLTYRLKKGRYSDEYLRSQHLLPADENHFPDLSVVKPGSVLFYHPTNSFLGWLVMYYTDGFISHCASVVDDNAVVDCTLSGVIQHSLADYTDGSGYIAFREPLGLTDELGERLSKTVKSKIGCAYSWPKALFLFWLSVTGRQPAFRILWLLDFTILGGSLSWVGFLYVRPLFWVCLVAYACYVLDVLRIRVRRHARPVT